MVWVLVSALVGGWHTYTVYGQKAHVSIDSHSKVPMSDKHFVNKCEKDQLNISSQVTVPSTGPKIAHTGTPLLLSYYN